MTEQISADFISAIQDIFNKYGVDMMPTFIDDELVLYTGLKLNTDGTYEAIEYEPHHNAEYYKAIRESGLTESEFLYMDEDDSNPENDVDRYRDLK